METLILIGKIIGFIAAWLLGLWLISKVGKGGRGRRRKQVNRSAPLQLSAAVSILHYQLNHGI